MVDICLFLSQSMSVCFFFLFSLSFSTLLIVPADPDFHHSPEFPELIFKTTNAGKTTLHTT